jgi:hypothetical protein
MAGGNFGVMDRWRRLGTGAQLVILLLVVAAAGTVLALALSGPDRPGDPALYARLESSSDCDYLRREFTAGAALSEELPAGPQRREARSYASVALTRLEKLGCPL